MLAWLDVLFALVALVLGLRGFAFQQRHAPALLVAMLLAGVATAAALGTMRQLQPAAPSPIALGQAGFAGSRACRACHPREYASWHASFHRSMTQTAAPEHWAAPELRAGKRLGLEIEGRTVELFQKNSVLWARLPDPGVTGAAAPDAYAASFRAAPLRDVPVRLLTGSHHHQAFWVQGAREGELDLVPLVYSIEEQRLLPRSEAFLNPPDAPPNAVRWNSNCVQCHAVAGAPGHQLERDVFETSAAELGIACEACHGGAAEHAAAMRNPLTRYLASSQQQTAAQMPHVTNPLKLDSERASQVCGRCHSYFFPKLEADWWQNGFRQSYAPGQDLSRAQYLLSPELLAAPDGPKLDAAAASVFYHDGTIRVGGREYNGLVHSPCYERGAGERRLSCLSCHSLHRSEPNDQLDPEKLGNRACLQCHEQLAQNVPEHTHHAAESTGSLCYNCHMPFTSYALLGSIRSHRVTVPAFDAPSSDRPNACSLCHLEQSEAWAAERARAWYGDKPRNTLERSALLASADLPAGAALALTGDAAVRAVTADALGRLTDVGAAGLAAPARALREQLLSVLERDDYAAVRFIAARSQKALRAPNGANASANSGSHDPAHESAPLSASRVAELLKARDTSKVSIAE